MPMIYSVLEDILRKEGISLSEFFALRYIDAMGIPKRSLRGEQMATLPIGELYRGLLTWHLLRTKGGVSKFVSRLAARRFVEKRWITIDERRRLFPESNRGWASVVTITPTGHDTLKKVNSAIIDFYASLPEGILGQISTYTTKDALGMLIERPERGHDKCEPEIADVITRTC